MKRGGRSAGKRHIMGRTGRSAIKGPMARQHPEGLRFDEARHHKGRMHWEAKAQ